MYSVNSCDVVYTVGCTVRTTWRFVVVRGAPGNHVVIVGAALAANLPCIGASNSRLKPLLQWISLTVVNSIRMFLLILRLKNLIPLFSRQLIFEFEAQCQHVL